MKKKKPKAKPRPKPKKEPAEELKGLPMCKLCGHRHSGVDHIWK